MFNTNAWSDVDTSVLQAQHIFRITIKTDIGSRVTSRGKYITAVKHNRETELNSVKGFELYACCPMALGSAFHYLTDDGPATMIQGDLIGWMYCSGV